MRATALGDPRVAAVAPFVEGEALLIADGRRARPHRRSVRGIDPEIEATVSAIADRLKSGSLGALEAGLVPHAPRLGAGRPARRRAGRQRGDGDRAGHGHARGRRAANAPVHGERHLLLRHVRDRQRPRAREPRGCAALFRLGDSVTGIRLAVRDPYQAPQVARDVARALGGGLWVEDWTQRQANFFRSIELTKRMMFFILLLVVAVAAFNIVSTLVMAVKDKQPDIAILRTLGARPSSVLAIFATQGTVIGLVGTLGGRRARRAAVAQSRDAGARPRAGGRHADSWTRAST